MAAGELGSSRVAPRKMIVEPLQQAFFFPPPFCRMTSAAGQPVDNVTDVYSSTSNAATIDLTAEITVNPREGEGSSVVDRVEFYKEVGGIAPEHIGNGTLVPGTSPPQYQLSYSADAHGVVGEAQDLFRQLCRQLGAGPYQTGPLLFPAGAGEAEVGGEPASRNKRKGPTHRSGIEPSSCPSWARTRTLLIQRGRCNHPNSGNLQPFTRVRAHSRRRWNGSTRQSRLQLRWFEG